MTKKNARNENSGSTANTIAFVSMLVGILAVIASLASEEIRCHLRLLPRICKGVYFISDNAYIEVGEADQQSNKLIRDGYPNAGHFLITDYPNLSGKHLYVVYADKFYNRDDCSSSLESYSQKNPAAYCFRASTNPNVDPDRIYPIR